eukprot:gene10609-12548_t
MADVDAFQARLQWEREALDASESEVDAPQPRVALADYVLAPGRLRFRGPVVAACWMIFKVMLRSRERALNESWQVQLQELEAEGTRLQQEFEEAYADARATGGAGDDVDDGSDPARTLQRRREEEDAAIRLKLETDPLLHGRWVHFPAIDEKWQYVAGKFVSLAPCLGAVVGRLWGGEVSAELAVPPLSVASRALQRTYNAIQYTGQSDVADAELLEALNSDFMWRTTSDRGAGPCAASTPTSTAALLDEPPLGLFPMARVLEGSRQGLKVSSVAAQWCTSQIGGDEGVLSKQLDSLEAGWRASERALHANRTHVKAMMDTNRRQHTAWDAHMADVDAFQARLQWEREALDASESE